MKTIKPKEPKLTALILTAVSGVLLGALLGASILLSNTASVVSTLPDEAILSQPGNYDTYYVPGRVAASESANLRSGKNRILRRSPGPVSFGEDEVNYFFENIEFGEQVGEDGEPVESGTKIGPFNVRIIGDQIWTSLKMVVDPKGESFEVLVLANVDFENSDDGPKLVVKSVRVNSLPVPGLGGVVSSMIAETPWPDDLVEMWQNIRKIEVESGAVITEVGLRRS